MRVSVNTAPAKTRCCSNSTAGQSHQLLSLLISMNDLVCFTSQRSFFCNSALMFLFLVFTVAQRLNKVVDVQKMGEKFRPYSMSLQ